MKFTLYFFQEIRYSSGKTSIVPWPVKIQDETDEWLTRAFICEKEFEIEDIELPSESETKQSIINCLEQKKQEIQSESYIKIRQIDDKIQQLLCIEMKDEVQSC